MADSKVYIIPLRREFQKASHKRKTNKAVRAVREFAERHAKADRIIIGEELNEMLWSRGITNPPAKVRVEITKETVKKDNADVTEAFVNLVGLERKVVEQKKKGIIHKEQSGMKEKLQGAVETIKGGSEEEKAQEAKKETPKEEKEAAEKNAQQDETKTPDSKSAEPKQDKQPETTPKK